MESGHIKLFRRLKKAPYYQDSQYVHLWIHLLMSVNWTGKRIKLKDSDRFIDILPGQFLTSRTVLVQQTGINRSKLERILKAFESEQQIEQQTFSKYRIISILNWQQYQSSEQQDEQQMSSKRAADEQQMSTNKKEKKLKKEPIPKTAFAENVSMTQDEFDKLAKEHGRPKTDWMIAKLDTYKKSSGKKYKCDYAAILSWVVGEAEKNFKAITAGPHIQSTMGTPEQIAMVQRMKELKNATT